MADNKYLTFRMTPHRIFVILMSAIFVSEAFIMLFIETLPPLPPSGRTLLDALLLSALIFPVLYLFVYRPFTAHIMVRKQTEEALRQVHDELEHRVTERTAELTHVNEELQKEITERKQVAAQLEDTLENLRKSLNTTIQVLMSAIETRDAYTAGHQARSADLARAIATEMGLPHDKIEAIRMAGTIHDIGKLSIPAEILSKPTKLSEIEFALIKEHAKKGFEMLKDVESPWPLAEIVHQHHERMDGSGYPKRIKGEEILLEARILAVADVVEAMASHRPYRPGLGIDAALNEIEKNRGIFYDNAAVDACLMLFREKGFQLATA